MSSPRDSQIVEIKGEQNVIDNMNSQAQLAPPTTKVYKYRWIILVLYMISTGANGFQWIQYSIISNVVQDYYSVKSVYVDWLTIIFMVAYLPFNYPALWLMDKKGLRLITVLGSLCNFLGAWIKVAAVRPDLYYVMFLGQIVGGIGQVFTLNAPSRVAAVWFGKDQESTACSIAVFGNQVGVALGFLLPPIFVQPHDHIDDIGTDLLTMGYSLAGLCSLHLLLVIFLFRNEPKLPPSPGEATRVTETPAFFDSLKRLARNRDFVLLVIAYGFIIGVFSAISTVLNQVVLTYYPGHEQDAGRIGLTLTTAGMLGSVVSGVILDKTHKFKETSVALFAFSTIGMLAFTFTLQTNLAVVYSISALLGFFMTAFLSVGFAFGAEITYPEPEGTTAGLINTSSVVFSIILTIVATNILNAAGDIWANVTLTLMLVIGTVLTVLIKQDLRRQTAHAKGEEKIS